MRFQRITTYYDAYLKQFYARQPGLTEAAYAVQHSALMDDLFGWSNFWETALENLGYETAPLSIINAEPLQTQWAAEHGISISTNWRFEIVLAQIEAFQPEILFVQPWPQHLEPGFIQECRVRCPSLKLVFGWCGEAHPDARFFSDYDLVLTCALDTLSYLTTHGIHVEHINHAFEPCVLDRLPGCMAPTADVGFIGQIQAGSSFHDRRAQDFARIARDVDLTLYGEVTPIHVPSQNSVKGLLRRGYYETLRRLEPAGLAEHLPRYELLARLDEQAIRAAAFNPLRALAKPSIFGLEMYCVQAGFKICLNAHGPSAYASNQRLYEATGVGTCLLTDWKDNLPDLFDPDREVVTYRSPEEAIEKIRYLLDHDDERRAIAQAGQRRTLRDHTIPNRMVRVNEIFQTSVRG